MLFAFCSSQRPDTSIVILLLLIQQATILQAQTPKAVKQLYERHFERQSVPTLKEVGVTLRESLRAFRKIYILIDGLDELADHGEPLLDELGSLITSFENLKILATSRPERSLTRHSAFDRRISIERRSDHSDLRHFIMGKLDSSPQLRRLLDNRDFQLEVGDKILNKAGGMYV